MSLHPAEKESLCECSHYRRAQSGRSRIKLTDLEISHFGSALGSLCLGVFSRLGTSLPTTTQGAPVVRASGGWSWRRGSYSPGRAPQSRGSSNRYYAAGPRDNRLSCRLSPCVDDGKQTPHATLSSPFFQRHSRERAPAYRFCSGHVAGVPLCRVDGHDYP